MNDDRCCGSGTCIINADDECWCGQKWDGEKMSFVKLKEIGNELEPDYAPMKNNRL